MRAREGWKALGLLAVVTCADPAHPAQEPPPSVLQGEVIGAGARIRIAVAETGSGREAAEFTETLRDDLAFSGVFDVVDPASHRGLAAPGGAASLPPWAATGAQAVVASRLTLSGQRLDVEAQLHDVASTKVDFAHRYQGQLELLRRMAHQLADDLVRHFTGKPGVALTRIAFVSRHGKGKEIYIMDYDGKRVRRLTTSGTINLSPVWSPSGDELAFVSWRSGRPGVWLLSDEGELRSLPVRAAELNSAADWSPDGRRLAYCSNADGNAEIYVLERGSGRNRRLTHHAAIDTSPAWSPNGREIAFTSDRSGGPQIYLMDADGLNVRRLTTEGNYNESAAWSPQGDRLAYVSRIEGRFQIIVLDLASGRRTQITSDGTNHEDPRWSPDGRHIVFSSNRGGRYQIYAMRSDGSNVVQLSTGPDSMTPDWSR